MNVLDNPFTKGDFSISHFVALSPSKSMGSKILRSSFDYLQYFKNHLPNWAVCYWAKCHFFIVLLLHLPGLIPLSPVNYCLNIYTLHIVWLYPVIEPFNSQ